MLSEDRQDGIDTYPDYQPLLWKWARSFRHQTINWIFEMKTILFVLFLSSFSLSYSQDTSRLKEINSLVAKINSSGLPVQRDSIVQDYQSLKMITHLSMLVNGDQLLKYVNEVATTRTENGITRQFTTTNIFYYDKNKLIKVEDYAVSGENKQMAEWYYWDDKPLYYTLKDERSEERAEMLLAMSKTLLKQIIKK